MKKYMLVVAAIALLGIVTAGTATAAPIQWAGNGHWYELIKHGSPLTWTEAQTDAISQGGYLATLTTAVEDSWVYNNVVLPGWVGYYGPWLGGYQPAGSSEPLGGWQWVNGEGAFTYANWNGGEPNNTVPGEGVLHMFMPVTSGRWNDVPDNTQYGFDSYVLEKGAVPEPMSIMLGIMGLGSIAGFTKLRRK